MDFLSALIAIAIPYGYSEDQVIEIHRNYCENLYFQPDALEKMLQYDCDVHSVASEVQSVKSGKY